MFPNFMIVGATRCGTTSLFYYLKQHPEIGFPGLKEPRYFSSINISLPQKGPGDYTVDKKLILDIGEYKKLFLPLANYRMIGEASSEYLYHYIITAEKIKETIGDIPIIIILRNPAERAYSAYNNLVRDGRETEPFYNALLLEEKRIEENWDMMWHYKSVGLYYCQVKKYLEIFSRVQILFFEEFIKYTERELRGIFEFLGVDENVRVDTRVIYSPGGKPKNKLVECVANRDNRFFNFLRVAALKAIHRRLIEGIAAHVFVKKDMSNDARKLLVNFFATDIIKLESLLTKDLSDWKCKGT